MVNAVTNVANFFIPIDITFTEGMLITRPSSFSLGYMDHQSACRSLHSSAGDMRRALEILNSNPEVLKLTDCSVVSDNQKDTYPTLSWANDTLTPYMYRTALNIDFFNQRAGRFGGKIVIRTNSTAAALQRIVIDYNYTYSDRRGRDVHRVVVGSIVAPSPLFFELKPSVTSKLVTIPISLFNNYSVPVVITRIGIPDSAATLISTSDHWNTKRFTVRTPRVSHAQMNRTFSAYAPPHHAFSPLFFVFHVSRFRSQV